MRCLLAALIVPVALAGTCADSASRAGTPSKKKRPPAKKKKKKKLKKAAHATHRKDWEGHPAARGVRLRHQDSQL